MNLTSKIYFLFSISPCLSVFYAIRRSPAYPPLDIVRIHSTAAASWLNRLLPPAIPAVGPDVKLTSPKKCVRERVPKPTKIEIYLFRADSPPEPLISVFLHYTHLHIILLSLLSLWTLVDSQKVLVWFAPHHTGA